MCLTNRAEENNKITFQYNALVEDILGKVTVEAVKLRNVITGEVNILDTDGVLIAIGWNPNSEYLKGQLELDEKGYIVTKGVKTSYPGVYVAGDINDKEYRQVVTACGSGCKAALEAERYINERRAFPLPHERKMEI